MEFHRPTAIVHLPAKGRRTRAAVATLLVAAGLVLGVSSAAGASERLESFDAEARVLPNGDLDVNETITWDFDGELEKHGIFRFVPRLHRWTRDRQPGWASWEKYDRVSPVTFLEASSPTGANTTRHTERKGDNEVLRLGDKDVTVRGVQKYRLHYVIGRAVVADELRYAITGRGWLVTNGTITARIDAPVAPDAIPRCEVDGEVDPNCVVRVDGDAISITAYDLGTEVVIPLDPARVSAPDLAFEPRQTLRRGFDWTNGQPFMAGALGVVSAFVLVLLGRRGRDRLYGSGAAFDGAGAPERPRALGERLAAPVEFAPPEGVAPGMVGAIRNGSVDHVALSSTLVDLAVRGHIRITAVEEDARGKKKPDHVLEIPDADARRKGELRGYEEKLIATLFGPAKKIYLSELKKDKTIHTGLSAVRDNIHNDVVAAGYWVKRPDRVRVKWIALGIVIDALGVLVTIVLAASSDKALLGIPIIFLGTGIIVLSPMMPVRTAKGSRVSARLNGFEKLFDAGEGERIAFTEKQDVFSQYLAYAMAFGNVKQWVERCAALGQVPDTSGWYTAPYGAGFDTGHFSSAIEGFEKSLSGAMSAASESPSSSSGGGGGGGGGGGSSGGGGGGSW